VPAKLITGLGIGQQVFDEGHDLFEESGPKVGCELFDISIAILLGLGSFEEPGGGAPTFGGRGANRLQGVELGRLHGLEHLLVKGAVASGGVADGGGGNSDIACGNLLGAAGGEEGADFGTFDVVEDGWARHG